MASKKNVRWAIVVILIVMALVTPKPALAGADCASGYQYGSNCCANPDGTNCTGSQSGNTCYDFAGGTMCYVSQSDGNNNYAPAYVPPTNNNAYVQPNYGNPYVPPNNGNAYATYAQPAGTYVVQWGDTMLVIANRMGIPLGNLIAANPQIWDPNLIYPGQLINLPSYSPQATYYQDYYQRGQHWGPPSDYYEWSSMRSYHQQTQSRANFYTIQPGDTLQKVARKYHTTVGAILDLNPNLLGKANRIHIGLEIRIW
jgi:LysM repeat protein